ncbi:MAG: nucleotide exchange factor GrpE [Lachnospiraceae bacterium]|nr:nucleotide exchange factor GrpE [Lachnospiraceae bacterium]
MEEERIDLQENISEESGDTQEELTREETQAQAADAADGCGAEGSEAEDGCEDVPAEEGDSKEEASSEKEEKQDKKLFKKKAKTDKKQEALKEKIDELEDKVKRQMAEFDNFRKRTEKEKSAMFETGAKSVIEKILPVVDNFERGLAAIPEQEKGSAFAEGMEMIYKQLLTELEKMEVKPIPAVGEEFNPEFHNAVMQVESEEFESGVIAQELLKGYTYRDSVVRHSMVAVVS